MYEIGHRITKLDSQLGAAGRAENQLLPPRAVRVALTKTETQGSVSMVTPQSIVQQMFPNAQKKAENVDCFRSLTHETSINMAVEKCGRPDEEVGSGLYIFVYHLRDGSTVAIGTPYLDRIFDITYTKPSGKSVPLLTAQQPTERVPKIICTPPSMKVLKMVRPTFPPDAKAKNIFGKVAVEAEIDKEGRPTSVRVLKGDPVLAAAVVEAVKKWRWKPLRLNGDAVEAVTTIVVNFEPR